MMSYLYSVLLLSILLPFHLAVLKFGLTDYMCIVLLIKEKAEIKTC